MTNLKYLTESKLKFPEENIEYIFFKNKIILKVEIPTKSTLKTLIYHEHLQKEIECTQGKITLFIGNKKRSLMTDESVVVHKKVPHSYYNPNNFPAVLHITLDYSEDYIKSLMLLDYLNEKKLLDQKGEPLSIYHKTYIAKLQNSWTTALPHWFQQLNSKIILSSGKALGKFNDLEKI